MDYLFFTLFVCLTCTFSGPLAAADNGAPSPPAEKPLIVPKPVTPATAPTLPKELEDDSNGGNSRFLSELLNMVTSLGLIVAAMFGVAWILKRMMAQRMEQANVTSSIKILERRVLTPKSVVYLIEVEGKRILVGESHTGMTKLTDL